MHARDYCCSAGELLAILRRRGRAAAGEYGVQLHDARFVRGLARGMRTKRWAKAALCWLLLLVLLLLLRRRRTSSVSRWM